MAGESQDGSGVVYMGRIPHGFYEHQMRSYFSQFGDITRLRLSRNRKTGHSKHYAFIEFASAEVAQIVADTMDKYLMFGHILQVRKIPNEQVDPAMFKGANRRFKVVPRNKIQGRKLRLGMEREGWEKRIETEAKRRKEKEEKLKKLGYEFEAPKLRGVEDVPMKDARSVEGFAKDEGPKLVLDKPHEEPEVDTERTAQTEPEEVIPSEKLTAKKRKSAGDALAATKDVKVKKPKKEGKADSKSSKKIKKSK